MKRSLSKYLSIPLALWMMLALLTGQVFGLPPGTTMNVGASPSADNAMVNGSPVTMQAYKIKGSNYVKLRDFASMVNGTPLNFEVTWDGGADAIRMYTQTAYTPVGGEGAPVGTEQKMAGETTSTIYINGKEVRLPGYNISNNNYFRLRDVGSALGIWIDWDTQTKTVVVDSTGEMAVTKEESVFVDSSDGKGATFPNSDRVIRNVLGTNGYPDGPTMPIEERMALAQATTLPPTDINHPGWEKGGGFFLATLKPGEEIPPAADYSYVGIEHTGEAGGASWSGVSVGG